MSEHEVGGGASRSTEPAMGSSAVTDISLREYFEALRHSDDKVDQWIFRFYEERDRRLTEVSIEREKALKIKETADLAALGLAREIQTYKDEKANELREQISSERGHYASKEDVKGLNEKLEIRLAPLAAYIATQQGRTEGVDNFTKTLIAVVGVVLVLAGLIIGLR